MNRHAWIFPLTFLMLTASAAAQPVAEAGEFQVNTHGTSFQDYTDVSMHADGSFVVVWQSFGSGGDDSDGLSVQAQRFAADGTTAGGELQVNSYTTGGQFVPAVAHQPDGGFVAAWESFGSAGDDNDSASIQARRFAADGTATGAQFQVNTVTTDRQRFPEVAVAPDGDFIISWVTMAADAGDVAARRFASDGTAVGAEFQVNTYTTSFQGITEPATWDNGDFVVIYESNGSAGDTSYFGILGQRYASDGSAQGSEFQVNSSTTGDQRWPAVDVVASGEFVVTWQSDPIAPETLSYGVRARRFDSGGTAIGGDFQVNDFTTGDQTRPAIAGAGGSEFVVTWQSYGSDCPSSGCSNVRRFDSGGSPLGGDLRVNTYTTDIQVAPEVAAAGDNFVVTWTSNGSTGSDNSFSSSQGQRYRSSCAESLSLTADQWHLVSLPCDAGASDTVADVFGDDLLAGDYGVRWIVYARDAVADAYDVLALADSLEAGEGYWLKTLDSSQVVDVDGLSNPVTAASLIGDAANGRQNLVGHPFPYAVCWADVQVIDGSSILSLDDADPVVDFELACSTMPPDPSCVMSRIANRWNGSAYAPFDGETPGAEGTLDGFDGLWVKAFKSGLELRIPALESSSCAAGGSFAAGAADRRLAGDDTGDLRPRRNRQWLVRLAVESGALSDDSAVFGQLEVAANGYDRHDLPRLAPFGTSFLSVVFPHPDWQERAGDYATDFHRARRRGRRDAWTFEVMAAEALEVTLSWQGPARALRGARLIDEETGRPVPLRHGSYTFQMAGPRHAFSWRRPGRPGD